MLADFELLTNAALSMNTVCKGHVALTFVTDVFLSLVFTPYCTSIIPSSSFSSALHPSILLRDTDLKVILVQSRGGMDRDVWLQPAYSTVSSLDSCQYVFF